MLSFNYPIHLEHVGRRLLGQVLIKILGLAKIQSRNCISSRIIALSTKPDTVTQKKVPILG